MFQSSSQSRLLKSTFVSLALIFGATSTFAVDTFTHVVTAPVDEVKASILVNVNNPPTDNQTSFMVGSCVITITEDADQTDCGNDMANISRINPTGSTATGPRTVEAIEAVFIVLTNVSDSEHGTLMIEVVGNKAKITTSGVETSATEITFTTNSTLYAPSGSMPGVVAVPQIVVFTPAASTAANTIYKARLNPPENTSFTYTTVGADSVQTIVENLQSKMAADNTLDFDCIENDVTITCEFTGNETPRMIASPTVTTDATAPRFVSFAVGG